MKRLILLLLALLYANFVNSQVVLHAEPPASLQQDNPPLAPLLNSNNLPANYNVGHNIDFTVRVKQMGTSVWQNLYEYNTFVNSNLGEGVGQSSRSSFVTFDLAGSAEIEIQCNNANQTPTASNVKIRPLSKGIIPSITNGNIIKFTINGPSKYAVEINGDRYRSLQIFANAANQFTAPTSNVVPYEAGINYYNPALNNSSKKIHIKPGAVLIVPFDNTWRGRIQLKTGDEIFIEAGGILKGGISGTNVQNVKIYGGGIIDLTNYQKQYNSTVSGYQYVTPFDFYNCTNVSIKGIVLNDSQEACMKFLKSNGVTIDNVKTFSRVLWGDGIHMEGTSNVTINDCFFRTSDDCIAIYAERHNSFCSPSGYTYKEAGNITCTNTLLYADKARPIEIGVHGDWYTNHELAIYNLLFDHIDILEHDDLWPLGMGAISINCADNNICADFTFRYINIEDFSNGRLFAINVEQGMVGDPCPGGSDTVDNGKRISNVKFENITYNGSGEAVSTIRGIDCDHYVNGVHFYNLKINGTIINQLSDYNVGGTLMFNVGPNTYNITFQEPDNYSNQLSEGRYLIRRKNTNYFLISSTQGVSLTSSPNLPSTTESLWQMEKVPGRVHYRFKNVSNGKYVECNLEDHPSLYCNARTLSLNTYVQDKYNQEWKIVPAPSGGYTVNNAYNYSYFTMPANGLIYSMPKETGNNVWEFIYVVPNARLMPGKELHENNISESAAITVYPNPVSEKLTINIQDLSENVLHISCYDIAGREVLKGQMPNGNELDVSALQQGNYILRVTDSSGNISYTSKFIKI